MSQGFFNLLPFFHKLSILGFLELYAFLLCCILGVLRNLRHSGLEFFQVGVFEDFGFLWPLPCHSIRRDKCFVEKFEVLFESLIVDLIKLSAIFER